MSQPSMTKRKSGGIVETIKTVVYAMLIAIGIRTAAAIQRDTGPLGDADGISGVGGWCVIGWRRKGSPAAKRALPARAGRS